MEETRARFELIGANEDLTDENVLEVTLMLAHDKASEELDRVGTHGYWPDDPEDAERQQTWVNALRRYLPKLERLMTARGMTFTPYRPFEERHPPIF